MTNQTSKNQNDLFMMLLKLRFHFVCFALLKFLKFILTNNKKMWYYNHAKLTKYIKIIFGFNGDIIPFFMYPNFEFDKNASSTY